MAVDKKGRLVIDWGVYGAPETFLVDARGIIVHKHVGRDEHGNLEARVRAASSMAQSPAGPT